MTAPLVRFAPSPTGMIHIGNARTALVNWLFALARGGRFILRFDDTDRERSRQEFIDGIATDLDWLGIRPHQVFHQSRRTALYDAAADRLRASGRLYPCYEAADELDRRRRRQLARGLPPIYDRAALALTAEDRARLEAEGRRPHWRFKLDGRSVAWTDLTRGPQHVDTTSLSDPVLVREDGSYLYTFTSVVDDIDMGITHVIRGEDHVTNTGVQIEIIEALGGAVPTLAHHNLIASVTGEALSKRLGSLSVRSLRDAGYEAMTVASLAVLVGTAEQVHAYPDLETLAHHLDLGRVSTSTAKFDPHELDLLNGSIVHGLAYSAVADRLAAMGINGGEPLWNAIRANCARLDDARTLAAIVEGAPTPVAAADDEPMLAIARELLPDEPWDEATWGAWTDKVKAATGRKGKGLFMPLRRALTGLDHGPELKLLLPLIGRYNSLARLSGPFSRPA
ncbi:MAG: glutamate--tRNA ligase [Hyphomicrobiaceae bacterium]|nr:glutamate--tRNA ligase [Hyphomicrobiaceae bacterium]